MIMIASQNLALTESVWSITTWQCRSAEWLQFIMVVGPMHVQQYIDKAYGRILQKVPSGVTSSCLQKREMAWAAALIP
jgi:hypothetical protein